MKSLVSALIFAAALYGGGAGAGAVVVDFGKNGASNLNAGDIVSQFPGFTFAPGVTGAISATGGINEAVVFDTNNPTGGDLDLASNFQNVDNLNQFVNFGNALIIQENADTNDPDDNAAGGAITFLFDTAVFVGFVDLLDIEEVASIFVNGSGVAAASGKVDNHGLPNDGPNQFKRLFLNARGVSQLTIAFGGSGAVGALSVVPTPASLPLLAGAVGVLGFVGWRRRN